MRTRKTMVLLAIGGLFGFSTWVVSAGAQESFYQGKTIRLIVGLAPGGGYDLYSRTIARQMGKYISGSPTIVVENMDGAGSLIAANHMYKAVKPDGLTVGHILGGLFLQQLLGNPAIEFDSRKFEYIGVPAQDHFLIGLSKATGITSFENWMASKKSVKLGGVTPGGATDDVPKVLAATLGLPIKGVSGYKGTGPIRWPSIVGKWTGFVMPGSRSSRLGASSWIQGRWLSFSKGRSKHIRNFPMSLSHLIFSKPRRRENFFKLSSGCTGLRPAPIFSRRAHPKNGYRSCARPIWIP